MHARFTIIKNVTVAFGSVITTNKSSNNCRKFTCSEFVMELIIHFRISLNFYSTNAVFCVLF